MLNTYIKKLKEFEKLCTSIEIINFKAHKYFPLTTTDTAKQELLVKFKRLRLQYQYLEIKKKKLSQTIITELLSSKNVLNSTDFDKLFKYQTQSLNIINADNDPTPKDIVDLIKIIANENLVQLKALNRKSLSLLLNNYPIYFDFSKTSYIKKQLFDNREFRFDLMEFNYEGQYFSPSEKEKYIKYLVYKYTGNLANNVTITDVRNTDQRAISNGLSAVSYLLNINSINECFIVYKGTEGEMSPLISSFNKRLDNYITESYNDWKYNINSMLLGITTANDQLSVARDFTKKILLDLTRKTATVYGLGHSLGGHLVQTLQVLDNPFDYGYTLNSAPVHLKQIYSIKPELHTEDTWQQLFNLTYYNTQNLDTDLKIRSLLKHSYTEIKNEWFQKDLTRIYYAFPYTIYIGGTKFLNTSQWFYPFISNISSYLKDEDIAIYQDFFAGIVTSAENSRNSMLIAINIFNYISNRILTLYRNINNTKTQRVFTDFANYLYESKIFKERPRIKDFEKDTSKILPLRRNTSWKKMKSEFPFLRSINLEMLGTVVFFHTVSGSRYFDFK